MIDRNASALAQIVEDVLDVSRIVLGKARLKVEATDLAAVVEDAIATVTPAVDAKGIRLKCHCGHGTATVVGRSQPSAAGRLESAVERRQVHAARRHHRRAGRAGRVGRRQSWSATPGIGFPASFRPHVFERFRQAESGTTRLHGGLGLGLAIARHIVEMHGGTIDAESAGEGKGATFSVKLPMSPVPAKV